MAPDISSYQQYIQDGHYPLILDQLPSNWTISTIGEVIKDIRSGFSSGQHNRLGEGIVHLRPMNISRSGQIDLKDIKYIITDSDVRVSDGDVLFNNTNSAELVGKTAPVNQAGEWAFSNHMTRLRPPIGLSHEFIAYQLHYLWLTGYFKYRSTQHVNQASISTKTLANTVPVVIAPENEQNRIVAKINELLGKLKESEQHLTRALSNLEVFVNEVLRNAVQGSLVTPQSEITLREGITYETARELLARNLSVDENLPKQLEMLSIDSGTNSETPLEGFDFPENEELGLLPEGWLWVRMHQVGEVKVGKKRTPDLAVGEHLRPYLRVANVFEDRIDTSDILYMNFPPEEYEIYSLRRGDILLNEGQSLELVGRPAMFKDDLPGVCFQNTLIRFRSKPVVLPEYALLVFRHYFRTQYYRKLAKWSTNIAHIGEARFASLEFPLPPLAEQQRIVLEAERSLSIAENQQSLIRKSLLRLPILQRDILHKGFMGQLVSQNHADENADELVKRLRSTKPQSTSRQRRKKKEDSLVPETTLSRKKGSLYDTLLYTNQGLSPEELLRASNYDIESIEDFYIELRGEISAGRIVERREEGSTRIILLAVTV